MRFRVERDPVLCGYLNGDVVSFVGLNFGIKSCVSFVQFLLLFILVVIARFTLLSSLYCIDLLIGEFVVQLLLAISSISCILAYICLNSYKYFRRDPAYSFEKLTSD